MLLAKGWTINNEALTERKWILISASVFLLCDVLVIIWKNAVENPAATNIPLGLSFILYCIVCFWFFWCAWFSYSLSNSYKNESNPAKRWLFRLLALIYIPWLFGLPFITFLQFALAPWIREKVVAVFSILISTFGLSFLSFLLWPTRAEEYFLITSPDTMTAGIANYEKL